MSAAQRFRALMARPGPILAPGVYDCLSARVVQSAGFEAGFISGAAVTASVLGYPDVGLQTLPEILNQCRNMARAVDIPLIADVDTGFGNALNAMRTVREFERAGLAGIFIEDQTFPKRCGHFEGKKVVPVEDMVLKIRVAVESRQSDDFFIIARTDSRAEHGLDHAIARARAYGEAGADMVFVEAMLSEAEMARVAAEVPFPLQANLSEGGKTPVLTAGALQDLGFKFITYSGLMQRSAIRGMGRVLDILKADGTSAAAYPEHLCSVVDRSAILGLEAFYRLEERLYGPLVESEGSWRDRLAAQSGDDKHMKSFGL